MIFVESPHSEEELEKIAKHLKGMKLLANMVEGGKTPLVPNQTLEGMGYSLVIYPNMLLRVFARAGMGALQELAQKGTSKGLLPDMLNFKEFNKMLGIDQFASLEAKFLPKDE